MAKQTINIGASPNDGTGTPLRTAFDYCNLNFTELYTATGPSGNNIVVPGTATITGDLTVDTSTLKVDSANDRVGIGTASPTSKLHVLNTAAATRITITDDSANGRSGYIESNFSDALVIGTTSGVRAIRFSPDGKPYYQIATDGVQTWLDGIGGTRMTLNSTGLGVGTSPSNKFHVKSTGSTPALIETSGGGLAYLQFTSTTGSAYIGNNGNGLGFYTTGSADLRMTLDASGNLLVGTTASGGQNGFCVLRPLSAAVVATTTETAHNFGALTGTTYATFLYATSAIGSITQNGTTGVLYNTTSDYRLKESVKPISGGLARVNALKPSVYNWKSDGSTGEGFLAHELAEVVPAAVSGEKDAVNADGSIKSQGIDMSRIVPILVAAIQELTAEVNALKKA